MATFTNSSDTRYLDSPKTSQAMGLEGRKLYGKALKVSPSSESEGVEGKELDQKIKSFTSMESLLEFLEGISEQREQQLHQYIESLKEETKLNNEAEFTVKVLDISWQVWSNLKGQLQREERCLEVPDACPGGRDNFMYTWSRAEHYLECEIFGNGEVEFFYKNESTGDVWGEDTTLDEGFSATILGKASIFSW